MRYIMPAVYFSIHFYYDTKENTQSRHVDLRLIFSYMIFNALNLNLFYWLRKQKDEKIIKNVGALTFLQELGLGAMTEGIWGI